MPKPYGDAFSNHDRLEDLVASTAEEFAELEAAKALKRGRRNRRWLAGILRLSRRRSASDASIAASFVVPALLAAAPATTSARGAGETCKRGAVRATINANVLFQFTLNANGTLTGTGTPDVWTRERPR